VTSWREIVEARLARPGVPGADKRMPLCEAIRRFVRPGMKLNPCSLQARPVAALHELCRQFAGREPGFEFVSSSLSGNYLQLVHAGLLRKAIVSFAGEGYPTPGPSPVVARALERGRFALESWTMLTISQRLLAGALGIPFLPTRSIAGSSLADELRAAGGFAEIRDPFDPSRSQGVVRAYQPDVSFVHAWAADPAGNALCFPPHQENVYGALAARDGVILTAHRIVSTDFIRRHAHLVRVPAAIVLSVSEAPYGSHPYGNYSAGIPELAPYANDYAFMDEHRRAQDDEVRYAAWMEEWIFGVEDQARYLAKLGTKRIERLHFLAAPDSWRPELERHAAALEAKQAKSPIEEMIVQGARVLGARVAARGYRAVLSGVGQAALMAWLAAHRMRDQGHEVALLAETGMVGHDPRPGDPFLLNYWNLPTTTLLSDVLEALGLHACGAGNRCLATLGAGEIDRFGNLNSSWSSDGRFIVGSGGANDVASAAQETLVVAVQRRATFVERVRYVTSPGRHVDCVVSTMGRFEKRGGDTLVLTGWFESAGASRDEVVRGIRERCGWDLAVADDLEALPPASGEELALLRLFDPERRFLGR
jgi:acyl CoA:acetate/3-ketoacid CoA transferase alpha subunit/acyl CoA:acetate/3-ketoacid CoA transferase beta subunit